MRPSPGDSPQLPSAQAESQPLPHAGWPPQHWPQTPSHEQSYFWKAIEAPRPQPSPHWATLWQPRPAKQQDATAIAAASRFNIRFPPRDAADMGASLLAIDGPVNGSAENR